MSDQDAIGGKQWTVSEVHRGRELKYEKTILDEVHCPECGNEEEIVHTETLKGQPIPPSMATKCPECDHNAHSIAFHNAWKRERMTDEELEEMRRQREKWEGKMVDYEYSAHGISMRREP